VKQISAIERLRSLPDVFRGADLTVRFHWTSKRASHYLYLWRKRGLVYPLGGHSDVFANILMSPGGPNWEKALGLAMPSAVVTGIEALRRAGWTTQVPFLPTVVVNAKQPIFKTTHFAVALREPQWFEITRPGLGPDNPEQLPVLRPAWALADLLREHGWGACGLTPDDIDGSVITAGDERDWRGASKAFGLAGMSLLDEVGASVPSRNDSGTKTLDRPRSATPARVDFA
jgi:hypothetical protein